MSSSTITNDLTITSGDLHVIGGNLFSANQAILNGGAMTFYEATVSGEGSYIYSPTRQTLILTDTDVGTELTLNWTVPTTNRTYYFPDLTGTFLMATGTQDILTTGTFTAGQIKGTDLLSIDSGGDPFVSVGDSESGGDFGFMRWVSATDALSFGTTVGGTWNDQLIIKESGNVGIGTTTPAFGLEVKASTTDGYFGISQGSGNTAGNLFIIDGSGNVGIASTTPSHTFSVQGDIYVSGDYKRMKRYFNVVIYDNWASTTATTTIVMGTLPFNGTTTDAHCEVSTASSANVVTFDFNINGISIMNTKLTIDASETGSDTAATPHTLNNATYSTYDQLTVDVDTSGTGTKGGNCYLTLIGE